MSYKLRPYQLDAIQRAASAIISGHRRILIAAATGSGKTVIAVEGIINPAVAIGQRVLFLAHRKELITQCATKLPGRVGIIKAGIIPDPGAPVQVASVQTLIRRRLPPADIIIIDECHHYTAHNSYAVISDQYPMAIIYGLSATPWRLDGRGMKAGFDHLIEVATISQLIALTFLVPPRTFAMPAPDLSAVRRLAGDYREDELATAMDTKRTGTALVQTWQARAAGRSTIIFAVNVAHSQHVAAQFRTAGITCEHIDGSTPQVERDEILARLADGTTMAVSNCSVLTEGFDCPRVSCIILARPTKSRGLWRQMIGRGLRTYDATKTDCHIHDHAGCRAEHGEITDEELLTLEGMVRAPSKAPPTRQCMGCYAILPGGSLSCSECGYVFPIKPPPPPPVGVHVILEEVAPVVAPTKADKEKFFNQMVYVAASRGWKYGAVSHAYKKKFGTWPMSAAGVEQAVKEAIARMGKPVSLADLDDEYARI